MNPQSDSSCTSPVDALIMAPSLGMRFSGINATMEALLPVMKRTIPIACCGKNLSEKMPTTTLRDWLRSSKRDQWRIWHSRRNNDMIVGLFLRYVLRHKLIMLWTSAAQRRHTWFTRQLYRHMDAIIATTETAANFLDRSSTVSHHGVDTSVYTPPQSRSAVRADLNLPNQRTLGVFGRVRPQKGTGDLVEALCQVLPEFPNWRIVFVGATTEQYLPYKQQLESQLQKVGIDHQVTFTGFLKNFDDLPKWYQAVDVVGCVSRNEGFGVTCLEGMASGAPVLATKAGAWPDIVEEGKTGWIAEANDPADLARALRLTLSTSQADLFRMGQQALATIHDRYTIHHESDRIVAVYRELLERYGEELPAVSEVPTHAERRAA